MDLLLLPVMDALRACVCEELNRIEASTCFCGLYPGPTVAADFCSCDGAGGCGMAFVRLANLFPATTFPSQDQTVGNCGTRLAAQLEIGVYRCLPVSGQNGTPDPIQLIAAAQQQTEDALALHRAIMCCMPAFPLRDHLLGRYTPNGSGDCGGGSWTLTVEARRDA